ncbi:hypothetical protein J1N35_022850 [Gossypium stocksii]|uniref:Reverse transcriptase domain-containing protein n=1 Tax=Gossypium stocksii TaxID=47602 RepID=A0A9D3VJ94_9ROSI|nr:hypothetical protein J1N35_022850 [Gossypium stocksii]
MKVIANHFKVVFPKIIEQEQARLIAWQNITDNIIIAQEAIHPMRSKQKNKKWMAVKIDLEKAYDRVLQEFIDASLKAANDLIIFGKVGKNHARMINAVLKDFCNYSSKQGAKPWIISRDSFP